VPADERRVGTVGPRRVVPADERMRAARPDERRIGAAA